MGKAVRAGMHWYYLDDGVYGSFSGQLFDHVRYPLEVFANEGPVRPSVLAGPTCDSIDVIAEDIPMPDLPLGTIVVGHMMGAYTVASATEFNSLKKAKVVVQNRRETPGIAFPLPEHFTSTMGTIPARRRRVIH